MFCPARSLENPAASPRDSIHFLSNNAHLPRLKPTEAREEQKGRKDRVRGRLGSFVGSFVGSMRHLANNLLTTMAINKTHRQRNALELA